MKYKGLTDQEVEKSRESNGSNVIPDSEPTTFWEEFKETFGDAPKFSINKNDKITTIQKQIKIKTREKTPGPGKYNNTYENFNKTMGKKIISKKFSKLKKIQSFNNNFPGPGAYDTKSSKDFGNSIKYSIGKSNRSEIIDKNKLNSSTKNKNDIKALDPAYYNIKETFGNVSFYNKPLIRGKPKNIIRNKTPGPGAYDTINSSHTGPVGEKKKGKQK